MNAPINLFFDITPIGQLYSIFFGGFDTFDGRMLLFFRSLFEMSFGFIGISLILISYSYWTILFFIWFMFLQYKIMKPMMHMQYSIINIERSKISSCLSFLDQTLRGSGTINAFGYK